jgi:hypothetical protein
MLMGLSFISKTGRVRAHQSISARKIANKTPPPPHPRSLTLRKVGASMTLPGCVRESQVRNRLRAGGNGPPTNDQAKKSGAVTPRDTPVVQGQGLQGKGSTVLARSRTLCAGSADAAALAAASLTGAARGALPGGGRDEGMVVFDRTKGWEAEAHAPAASRTS